MNVWFERRTALMELGFDTYEAYLFSDLWKGIRRRVLDRDRKRCRCGARATQVHHRRYAKVDLSGATLSHLMAICRSCHEFGSKDGERITTPDEATIRIMARVKAIKERKRGLAGTPGPSAGNPPGSASPGRLRRRKKERERRMQKEIARKVELQKLLGGMRPKKKSRPTARPHQLEDGTWDVSATAGRFRT